MKKSKAMRVIEAVAVREGKPVSEIRQEMIKAIDVAYENRGDEPFWQRWKGEKPTLEQFLAAANNMVLDKINFGGSE